MKLIMENWRKKVLKEEEELQLQTVGDLWKAFQYAILAKTDQAAKSKLKKAGAGFLADLLPGSSTTATFIDFAKTFYGLPDDKAQAKPGLKHLGVDDQLSTVIDDKVENNFLNYYAKELHNVPHDTPLSNVDVEELLSTFINNEFEGTIVKAGN